jgi:hypothetical protein
MFTAYSARTSGVGLITRARGASLRPLSYTNLKAKPIHAAQEWAYQYLMLKVMWSIIAMPSNLFNTPLIVT